MRLAVHVLVARVVGKESAAILLLQEIGEHRIDAMAAAAVDKAGLSALRALCSLCFWPAAVGISRDASTVAASTSRAVAAAYELHVRLMRMCFPSAGSLSAYHPPHSRMQQVFTGENPRLLSSPHCARLLSSPHCASGGDASDSQVN